MASQDVYEDQVWKKEVGVPRVIEWCVAGIEVRDFVLLFIHSCALHVFFHLCIMLLTVWIIDGGE